MDFRPSKDFDDHGQKKKRRRWGLWLGVWIVIFGMFGGVIWFFNTVGLDTDTMLSNAIPKCDSKTTLNLAKRAIEGSPMAKVVNITAFEFRDAEEIAYDATAQKRTCKALAYLNSGKHKVQYSLE